jgi:hypothetical protein
MRKQRIGQKPKLASTVEGRDAPTGLGYVGLIGLQKRIRKITNIRSCPLTKKVETKTK